MTVAKDKKPAGEKPKGRKKNQSREILAKQNLSRCKTQILTGNMLCIDPSCGSASSMPGWARYINGILTEAGTLDIPIREELRVRLRIIHELLQEMIEGTDVVLIEEIPVKALTIRGIRMKDAAHNSIMQSIGATKAAFPKNIPVLNMPASLWSRLAREHGWAATTAQHEKSDVMDAVRIGMAAIHLLTPKREET